MLIENDINVLITSSGRRVELIQAFQNARDSLGINGKVIVADCSKLAPSLYIADDFVVVPRLDSYNYIDRLIEILIDNDIKLLIPTIDTELKLIAKNKAYIENNTNTKIIISSEDVIDICESKLKSYDFFINNDFLSPRIITEEDIKKTNYELPLFIKPDMGSSSINTFKINNEKELSFFKEYIQNPIIQEYANGEEYTIDVFCDFNSEPITIVPRNRLKTRSGEVLIGEVIKDRSIIKEVKRMIGILKPIGHITIQCIKTHKGNEYIEINPRFGGGAPISIKAGADSPKNLFKLILGEKLEYNEDYEELISTRYDQAVFLSKNNSIKAVVFDLDDTLYLERNYVLSGFKEVAKEIFKLGKQIGKLYSEEQIYNTMVNKFNEGSKKVFNETLETLSIKYTMANIKELIKAYRSHMPEINLPRESKEILDYLKKNEYKLGLITDGYAVTQRNKIKALDIEKYFDEIIITDELGRDYWKPHELSYIRMKESLNIELKEMIYIGDNINKDFITAKKLGIKTGHIIKDEGIYKDNLNDLGEEYYADYEMNHLSEIKKLLIII